MDRLLIFKDQYERLLADLEHFRIYIATYSWQSLYNSTSEALAQIDLTEQDIVDNLIPIIERSASTRRTALSCSSTAAALSSMASTRCILTVTRTSRLKHTAQM